ncbi:extracellular solute-binding protein [Bradyrhizobium sp. dw_78]|uniref:twin-arginine translocation signal domain-containing protein n=1 Tax=Bradyrhizobium sp. dw_78 TaxID=2719793 RepID=UPI001BD62568|nr:extracellular solute-binding protein [Bradyrhizobium sp. dw_78]
MEDKLSTTSQLDLARRDFLKGLALAGAAMALPSVAGAADANVITGYGVTTAQLKDWSIMEKSTGLKMQFSTVAGNDIGALIRDVISSGVGDKFDLVFFAGGSHNILGPRGFYAVLDEKRPELTLWDRTSDVWKRSSAVVGPDGKQYGVPVTGNADSFGYFADKIGVNPDGQEDVSWQMLFENERTHGRAAFSRTWNYSAPATALYLKESGKAKIENPADLTPDEAKTVVDFLVARKKAGQFKTLIASFEEQVQLLTSREVDIANCWEPATREANKKLGDGAVRYAYTIEGYTKWGQAAYIAMQATKRDNLSNIYKTLNYFLGGEYRAYQAKDRGYGGPNMDLGVQYAIDNKWPEADVTELKESLVKIERKYKKPFVANYAPSNADAIEQEWQRFLSA